jgi:hypothetical protein
LRQKGLCFLQRVPLDELCLQIKLLDLGDVAEFLGRAIEPPRVEAVTVKHNGAKQSSSRPVHNSAKENLDLPRQAPDSICKLSQEHTCSHFARFTHHNDE